MQVEKKKMNRRQMSKSQQIASASRAIVERIESRVLMSSTVAAWSFDNLTVTTTPNLSPAPSTGTGTALTVGMQTASSNTNSPGGVYAYPNPNASGTGDISDILNGTGNNAPATSDNSSTGQTAPGNSTGVNPAWRIRGSSDGWSDNAAVGSQGAQFTTSTLGDSGISLSFDLDPSSGSAPSEIAVEYTTDGTTWNPVPASDLGTPTSSTGATTDVSVATGTGGSLINGGYYQIANSTTTPDALFWQNGFNVNLTGITAVNNDPNFSVRIVNAASGASEFEVSGTAYPAAGAGNWRLDNVVISAAGAAQTPPSISSNPVSQTVPAGSSVTFSSAASGNPTPTVQWYEGGTPEVGLQSSPDMGGGTLLSGDTSPNLTFTTSSTAADNNNTYWAEYANSSGYVDTTAATLHDPLAAPIVTTQPTSVSTTAGTTVTFTSAASGSPAPTEGWQVSTNGGASYSPITSGQGGYTINSNGSLSFTAASEENGYKYEAVFTNSQAPGGVDSNPATLSLGGTAITVWNFSNGGALVAGQTDLSPAPSSGSGTATSLGMGSVGTYSFYPGDPAAAYTLTVTDSSGTYTTSSIAATATAATIQADLRALNPATTGNITVTGNPTASAASAITLTGDSGATLTGSGSSTFFVTLDAQATSSGLTTSQVTGNPDDSNLIAAADTGSPNADPANINAWRIVGTNGWNSNAPIGTQGAQFLASTSGYSSIEVSFDLYATGQGEAKMQVEYTTDGSTWTNVSAADLSIGSGDTNISVQNNTSSANTVQGGYFDITGGGSSNSWYNGLGVNLTGISGVNNNPNFGVRIVNAATGADCVNISGAALNNSSGNDRLGDVQIIGNNPIAPVITTNPISQSVALGSTATFTAAAYGYPAPTVQWEVSTDGGVTFAPDTTDSGNTTTALQVVASTSNRGNEYEAIFTNSVGSTPTTAATLNGGPAITTQPLSQTVPAGTTVTLVATATGNPTPTEAWEVATPNGTGGYNAFTNITSGSGGYTILPNGNLSFTADEGMTGNEYEAIFTNSAAPSGMDSNPAVLTVTGTPIAQWIFTGGEAPPPGGSTNDGTGNDPYPTFGPISNTASTLGLQNDYTGIEAFPESDILVERSTLNPSFSEYDWRIRSGNGYGPTGSPGTPEGWSQNAPEYSQGVQFDVNTTGYSNITLHFDWNQGGISDMQPLYSTDGGQTWNVLPNGLITQTAPGGDFYGITPTTAPTGVTVNLQGIAGVGNNPNFELRLAAAYDPSLPLITDGNEILNGGNTSIPHGQYASGIAGPVNAQQVIQFGTDENSTTDVSGGTFTLTFGGATTGPIAFSSNNTTLAANITAALNALTVNGTSNYLQGNFTVSPTNYSGSTELNPVRDALGVVPNTMTVTFDGALAATAVPTMTANGSGLTGSNPSLVVQDYVNGSTSGFEPYVDGGGAWQLGNISFNGDASTSGGLGIVTNPVSAITAAESHPVTLTATAYSETTPVTAQWYMNGSPVPSVGAPGSATSGTNVTSVGNSQYTSTYTFTTDATPDQSGDAYYVVFSDGSSTAQSASSTLTVVTPAAPLVIIPPANTSVQSGNVTTISATATGSPAPTVVWQVSTDGGQTWSPVSNNTTYSGANTVTTTFAGYVATLSIASATSMNGYEYEAVFSNGVSPAATSSPAKLTVLTPETVLNAWDFNSTYPIVSSASNSPDPYIDGPAPVAAGVDGSIDVGGAALPVGMDVPYAYYDSATGTDGNGAVAEADIVNSPGALNPSFNENTWRVRGGPASSPTSAGTPANGWSNFVPQYSQGVQFNVPTTGYQDVYVTLDWYSTTSGELDAQEQYTVGGTTVGVTSASSSNTPVATAGNPYPQPGTNNIATLSAPNSFQFGDEVTVTGLPAPYDGTFQIVYATPNTFSYYTPTLGSSWTGTGSAYVPTWTNINNPVQAVSNDFYGATVSGGPVPLLIDVSAIPGAANNPNFGIRLVNAYDPYLSNTQTLELGDTNNFTLTFKGQTTGTIAYSSNPAQMAANVQAALAALSTVNGASNVTVTAPQSSSTLTITFGGALDAVAQPAIVANDPSDTIVYTPQYANALLVTGTGPNGTTTQVPAPYNGSKGNWRFDNIEVHGIAIPPVVTSISPASGPGAGGTTVTITGTGFTGATAVDFGTTPASSFTVNNDGSITAVDPAGSGTVDVTVVTAGGTSATSSADQFTYTSSTVSISSVVVNGNSSALAGVQRSMVNSIEYTFAQAVILNQTNAFSIALHSGQSGTVPTLTWTAVNPDASGGSTQWVVTFSGAGVSGGSIANGVYDITLNAAGVSGESGGTLASSRTDTFYRLFGDAQGTKNVSTADYNAFLSTNGLKSTAPGYLAEFAADGSGKIDTSDYNAFLADLGKKLTGFTPTI